MKIPKFLVIIMCCVFFMGNTVTVNAAHQHGDSCYSLVGGHTHSGDSVNGGGCYTTPVYHVHTGDATSGGGCYTTPVYHVHTGSTSAGGGCYGNPHTVTLNCTMSVVCIHTTTYACGTCNGTVTYQNFQITHQCSRGTENFHIATCGCGRKVAMGGEVANGSQHAMGTQTVYDLICGNTTESIVGYEVSCGKTESTIEGYSLGCGQSESAPVKTLTCTIPESTPAPAATPAPTAAPTAAPTPVVTEAPVATKAPSSGTTKYTYTDMDINMYATGDVNVRDLPSTGGDKLGGLDKDEKVHVTGQCNQTGWYRIEYNGSVAYVSDKYLTPTIPEGMEETTVETETIETEEIIVPVNVDDFDFEVFYKFVDEGLEVVIMPTNVLALGEAPYSWDNKVTWTDEEEGLFNQTGTYYISIRNVNGEIKTKVLTIDLAKQTVEIVDEEAPLATASDEVKKDYSPVFKTIGIILLCLIGVAGIGFLVFLLLGSGSATVIDKNTDIKLGTTKIKKAGNTLEAVISDKILMNQDAELAIVPDKATLKKYIGYSLLVKSSEGSVETEISNVIEVNF